MRKLAISVVALSVFAGGTASAVLDCTRVQKLHAEGKRPADIARELGVTTPEVQECMAGEAPEKPPAASADSNRLPLSPQRPAADNLVPRGPNQQ